VAKVILTYPGANISDTYPKKIFFLIIYIPIWQFSDTNPKKKKIYL